MTFPNRLLIHSHTTHIPRAIPKERGRGVKEAVPAQGCCSASSHSAALRGCSEPQRAEMGHCLCLCSTCEGLAVQSSHKASCYNLLPPKCFHATWLLLWSQRLVYLVWRFCSLACALAAEKVYQCLPPPRFSCSIECSCDEYCTKNRVSIRKQSIYLLPGLCACSAYSARKQMTVMKGSGALPVFLTTRWALESHKPTKVSPGHSVKDLLPAQLCNDLPK